MSDSKTDVTSPAGDFEPVLDSLKESVSTENDTEVDIEEMPSIAEYDSLVEEAEVKEESKQEPSKNEPSTPKRKDTSIPAMNAGALMGKDAAAAISTPNKDPSVPKEEQNVMEEPNMSNKNAGTLARPKQNTLPEDIVEPKSPPKPSDPLQPIETDKETDHQLQTKEAKENLEAVEKGSVHDDEEDAVKNSENSKSKHSNSAKSKSKSTASKNTKKEESKKEPESKKTHSEKTLTPATKSHSTKRSTGKSHSPSKSRSRTSEKKSSSNYKQNETTGSSEKYRSTRSCPENVKVSSSRPARNLRKGKPSSSYTTFARAETTPSRCDGTTFRDREESIPETDDLVSMSSGLQLLRDMFFDEDDSHKCYFGVPDSGGLVNSTYCSHNHGDTMSRISNASFDSHVEPGSPVMKPEFDQATFVMEEDVSKCSSNEKTPVPGTSPVDPGKVSPIAKYEVSDYDSETPTPKDHGTRNKKVDFVAGNDVISLTLNEISEKDGDQDKLYIHGGNERDEELSIASEDIIKSIDRKYISFTPNTLLCDLSNIIPNHANLVKVEGRHILNKEVCLEFMCWLENLNDLYMSPDYGRALNIFRRQESRFKIVLYECLKVAQGCGLDIGLERVAAMAHIAFDVIYTMLPYCDAIKWYSQMVAGAQRVENKLAEAYMLMCLGQLMIYSGDSFEAQRHLKKALVIVKAERLAEQDLYNCIKHLFGFSVAMCDCNTISQRESGLIKMTEALVMTRNLFGTNSLETALGRLHIGIAYKSLYEDTALRLEGLDYVERAHEVLEDKLGHHPYMGICLRTLAQYHDVMLNINFNAEYNQAVKCYKLATDIHKSTLGGHSFTARTITQLGDFYHRMADYQRAGDCLTAAQEMALTYCPTDVVYALASFHLGLLYMDDQFPEHDIFRGQTLLSTSANLLSKYGVTYQRATMLQHMGIASEEAGLRHTFYKQESENIKSVMFGPSSQSQRRILTT